MSKYKNNYLTNVILRVDFLSPINIINDKIPYLVGTPALKLFPISEPVDMVGSFVHIDENGKVENKYQQTKEWNFYSKDRENRLCISSTSMFIDFTKYDCFDDFTYHFIPVMGAMFKFCGDLQVSRIGLRYIDNIAIEEKDPFNWKKYINKNLIAGFDIPEDKNNISRLFQVLEMNYGEFNVRFQYGMHNPDFPAPIKKKIFILDTDVYSQGLFEIQEIVDLLPVFHVKAKLMFENAITENLRKKMDNYE